MPCAPSSAPVPRSGSWAWNLEGSCGRSSVASASTTTRYEATQLHTNLSDEPRKPKSAATDKVGRNELCPCGSGKKYKRCHGAAA